MKKRFFLLIIDGLGVGAMKDVPDVRPGDAGACTLGSILASRPDLRLPSLERLGLMNALGRGESPGMKFSASANWGRASLMHWGADTFWGHQEIMGSLPRRPHSEPFSNAADRLEKILRAEGCKVERTGPPGEKPGDNETSLLKVEDALILGDNLEADPGQNYNVTADLSRISFDRVLEIGHKVRRNVKAARVICCGNVFVGMDRLLKAIMRSKEGYCGVSSAESGVYGEGYRCVHLGYGADPALQVPALLAERDIPVVLLGKAADVVENPRGKSVSRTGTEEVLSMALEAFEALDEGFICANVQEADLAAHMQDAFGCAAVLEKTDLWLGRLLERLQDEDVLLVMADHGNDPRVGGSRHTREEVPVLLRSPRLTPGRALGDRKTLSDAGATVCAYFGARMPENPHASPLFSLITTASTKT